MVQLTEAVAVTILQQCAAAMHHLHSIGILHRDFRAANVLIDAETPLRVVVCDFGLSHALSHFQYYSAAAANGSVVHGSAAQGPLAWMAPEVVEGLKAGSDGVRATSASDVYMFGGLMLEVLTGGTPPFHWVPPGLLAWRRQQDPSPSRTRRRDAAGGGGGGGGGGGSGGGGGHGGGGGGVSGLRGLSSLEAAVADGEVVTYAVVPSPSQQLVALMTQCLATKAEDRPTVAAIITALQDVGKGEQWTSFCVSLFESSVVLTALVLHSSRSSSGGCHCAKALLCNWCSLYQVLVLWEPLLPRLELQVGMPAS